MKNIPDKCSRCGAPIIWEEGASNVRCDFCGNINYPKKEIFNFNIAKNNIINRTKNFLINKKILNKNQINYINDKSRRIFKKKYFRFSILIIFISTPIVIYKQNQIHPKLIAICEEIQKEEKTDVSAKKSYKNCIRKIELINTRKYLENLYDFKKICLNIEEFQNLHLKLLKNKNYKYKEKIPSNIIWSQDPRYTFNDWTNQAKFFPAFPNKIYVGEKGFVYPELHKRYNSYYKQLRLLRNLPGNLENNGSSIKDFNTYNFKSCYKELAEGYKDPGKIYLYPHGKLLEEIKTEIKIDLEEIKRINNLYKKDPKN